MNPNLEQVSEMMSTTDNFNRGGLVSHGARSFSSAITRGRNLRATVLTCAVVAWAGAFGPAGIAATTQTTGQKFSTPEEAVAALLAATSSADTNALRSILGPSAEDLVNPDRIQAKTELNNFSSALAETNHLDRLSDTFVVVDVGNDMWPFPVPLVKKEGGWYFDTEVGRRNS
jgi:hypothetical protein